MVYGFNTGAAMKHWSEVYASQQALKEKYIETSAPWLIDQSLIPHIRDIFCQIVGCTEICGEHREIFIFVVFLLYDSDSLFDDKTIPRLRSSIAAALGLKSQNIISRIKDGLLTRFKVYFCDEADRITNEVMRVLREEGHIRERYYEVAAKRWDAYRKRIRLKYIKSMNGGT